MLDYVTYNLNFLESKECNDIINFGKNIGFEYASNLAKDETTFYDANHRNCKICTFKYDFPIEDINLKLKNNLKLFAEKIALADHHNQWTFQIAKYDVGNFHNWHVDDDQYRNCSWTSGFRKFVTIIQLSSSNDYEGGQLEIQGNNGFLSTKQGSCVSFLTIRQHRVLPITKGIRYSLVVWLFGPPWR